MNQYEECSLESPIVFETTMMADLVQACRWFEARLRLI
jgi:hypothetical protein